ncbi:MAG: hypothetical protein BGO23_08955 [Solirubrobacterales bacterium 67-14]|nr:MAG: hypothetical protein BGO23_08955 [Solirubrobacterales bacterium 67-14]
MIQPVGNGRTQQAFFTAPPHGLLDQIETEMVGSAFTNRPFQGDDWNPLDRGHLGLIQILTMDHISLRHLPLRSMLPRHRDMNLRGVYVTHIPEI